MPSALQTIKLWTGGGVQGKRVRIFSTLPVLLFYALLSFLWGLYITQMALWLLTGFTILAKNINLIKLFTREIEAWAALNFTGALFLNLIYRKFKKD